jgi:hypothetical protein
VIGVRRDASWQIRSLLVKAVALFAFLAVGGYDVTQVVLAQVRAESVSRAAALAGADTYYRTHRTDLAERDAVAAAAQVDPSAAVTAFSVDRQGVVTVTAVKDANTLVVRRIGFLERYNRQRATDQEVRTA